MPSVPHGGDGVTDSRRRLKGARPCPAAAVASQPQRPDLARSRRRRRVDKTARGAEVETRTPMYYRRDTAPPLWPTGYTGLAWTTAGL